MAYAVLYVDDDEWRHPVVRHSLEWAGWLNITGVQSAAGALDLLASGTFDAVVSVYTLPAMDGIAFLQAVRSRCGDLPVLFFSSEHSPWIREEAVRHGALSVHFMPLGMPEFREAACELTTAIELRRGGPGPKHLTVLDQALLDSLPGIAVLWDSGMHLVQWNRNLGAVSGYAPEVLAGMNLRALLPEFRPGDDFPASMEKLTAEGQASQDVLLHVRTGERIPYLITFRRLEIGGMEYFAGTGTDIRERREAEDRCNHALTLCSLKYKLAETVVQKQASRIQYAAESMPGRINREELEKLRDTIMAATDVLTETVREAPPGCEHLRTGESRWQDLWGLLVRIRMPPGIVLEPVLPLPEVFANDCLETVFAILADHAGRHGGPGPGRASSFRVSVRSVQSGCLLEAGFNGTAVPWNETEQLFARDSRGVRGINLYQAAGILKCARIRIQNIGPDNPPSGFSGARFLIRIPHGRFRFPAVPEPPALPAGADESPAVQGGACWQAVAAVLARMPVPEGVALVLVPPLPVIFADISMPAVVSLLISYTCRHSRGVTRVEISASEEVYGCDIRIAFDGTGLTPEEMKKNPFAWRMNRNKRDVNGIAAAGEILERTRIGIMASAPPGRAVSLHLTVPVGWYAISPAAVGPPAASAELGVPGTTGPGPAHAGSTGSVAAPQSAPAAADGQVGSGVTGQRTAAPAVPVVRKERPVSPQAAVAPVAGPAGSNLQEQGEIFRILAENLPNTVLIMDRDLRFRYVNSSVPGKFGETSFRQAIGKTPAEAGLPDHAVRLWNDAANEVFASGKLREIEFRLRKDSELVCWTLAPVHGPDGSVMQILAVDRWKPDLAAVMSADGSLKELWLLQGICRHDILNQATVMASSLAMLSLFPAMDEKQYPQVRYHCDRIRQGLDVICDRVNATRYYLDIMPRELQWQKVAAVIASRKMPEGIRMEIVSPLPAIFADIKLPVVFESLLSYSGTFSGGVSSIRISAVETADGCVIRIEDDGTGIPEEEKKRIFSTSYADHRDFDLMIAAGILAETHIRIRENGIPGEGIRFEITVPKGWYRFGPAPALSVDLPVATGRKKE